MLLLAQAAAAEKAPLSGFEAIVDGNGIAISITGLVIVFAALTAISLFLSVMPKLLHVLEPYLPEIESHHDQPAAGARSNNTASSGAADPRLAAAIGWAMHASRRSDP